MPIYCYETITDDGSPGEAFEVLQPMSAPPLTQHPETGAPVRRLISAPYLAGEYNDRVVNNELKDNARLERLGFTKYERRGKGIMERTAGHGGPKIISGD